MQRTTTPKLIAARQGTNPASRARNDETSMKTLAAETGDASPTIVVLRDRYVSAEPKAGVTQAAELRDALNFQWDTDAHFCAYEPVEFDGVITRLAGDPAHVPGGVRMVALVGDLDDPIAHRNKIPARPEWRLEQIDRILASGLAYYETRGGYRVLATLAEAFELTSAAHAEQWKARYVAWCDKLEAGHGLLLDRACKDWTRLYRLPNVQRDGKEQRAEVRGDVPAVKLPAARAGATAPKSRQTRSTDDTDRACVIAEHMPPSIAGHGGDEALFKAACEIATVLSEPEAIEAVLSETFNPRCVPPWDAAKLKREAKRAAERQAQRYAEGSFGRKREAERERREREQSANDNNNDSGAKRGAVGTEPTHLGPAIDLSTPIQKLRYLCEGLGIAFDGKCAAVHGYAGSSKGLFMSLIALCVASGKPVFGVHPVARVPVVYGDAETGVLAEIRLKRLALALGVDLGELVRDGWFRFHRLTHQLTDVMGDLEAVCRTADKGEGCAVALDSYSSLVAGDENKSEYADPMWELGRMGSRVNAVPIVTMHERKGDRDAKGGKPNPLEGISGTNRLAAALATSIRLTPSEADDKVITVTCTRAPEARFKPIELTWADEGEGLAARTVHKAILTQAEIAERKAVEKQDAQAQALAERIARAERAILFRLAEADPAPDASVHPHMRPERPLTATQLARAAGVHPSKQGDGEAPAILQRLVIEGWLKRVEGSRFDTYALAAVIPKEARRWGKEGEQRNKFDYDGRHRALVAEIQRGRTVGSRD